MTFSRISVNFAVLIKIVQAHQTYCNIFFASRYEFDFQNENKKRKLFVLSLLSLHIGHLCEHWQHNMFEILLTEIVIKENYSK